jgi:hypothetical protein
LGQPIGPTFKGLLNYKSTPRNIPEVRRTHGNLKSLKTELNMRIKIFKKERLLNMVLNAYTRTKSKEMACGFG